MRGVSGPGRVVAGRYELLDRIGQGAMGTVWRARDRVLARDVAVKEVRLPDLMPARDRAILRERTLREARVSAKLSHPCVVTVHDVIETDGTPWIVMELVAARSLERVLAEDGPLPPRRVAETGIMLLGALASAHAAGIVHRDVKPGNVLLTRDGRAVLTDFGIAAVDGDPALTQTGMVVGTPGFCAPERIRGAPASPASDLWSLGATLYAAVEGRGPFDGHGSPMAVLTSIVHSDPPPPRSAGPLEAVIGALMSKDPAQRPDAARARELLTGAAAALGTASSAVGAAPASSAGRGAPASAGVASRRAPGRPPATARAGRPPRPTRPGSRRATRPRRWLGRGSRPFLPAPDRARSWPARHPSRTPGAPVPRNSRPARARSACPISSRPEPFPASPRPGLFPAAAGPALIPAGATLAGPAVGLASLPVSMDAAPFPARAGRGRQPGATTARPSAAPRLLVLGLAGAAVILAGLVWWLVASPRGASATAAGPLPPATAGTPGLRAAGAPGFTMAAPAGWQAHRRGAPPICGTRCREASSASPSRRPPPVARCGKHGRSNAPRSRGGRSPATAGSPSRPSCCAGAWPVRGGSATGRPARA